MSLTIESPISAIGFNRVLNLAAQGGTPPYSYQLLEGVGGQLTTLSDGSVNYTAPAEYPESQDCLATIKATDDDGNTAEVSIIVGDYQTIICDILARELGLEYNRVFLFNQKYEWPKDEKMFIEVGEGTSQLISNIPSHQTINDRYYEIQTISMATPLEINIYSRGREAVKRHAEIPMALNSTYSIQQQGRNGISIAKITLGKNIKNLSELDGAAMMNRFLAEIVVNHSEERIKEVPYFDKYTIAEKVNA